MRDPIIVERTYNAPIERVWNAIVDKDEMKNWYFDLTEFKAEPGFQFQFYGEGKQGEKFLDLCKVIEVIPMKKLTDSWRDEGYEGNSFVIFEMLPEGDKTKLKLSHK